MALQRCQCPVVEPQALRGRPGSREELMDQRAPVGAPAQCGQGDRLIQQGCPGGLQQRQRHTVGRHDAPVQQRPALLGTAREGLLLVEEAHHLAPRASRQHQPVFEEQTAGVRHTRQERLVHA